MIKYIWYDEYQILDIIKIDKEQLNKILKSPILRRTKNFIEIYDNKKRCI